MVRPPLSQHELDRGVRLGELLRTARGTRTGAEIAHAAGISVETLRKIEHGRIATPAFFTVLAIAEALELPLDRLSAEVTAGASAESPGTSAESHRQPA